MPFEYRLRHDTRFHGAVRKGVYTIVGDLYPSVCASSTNTAETHWYYMFRGSYFHCGLRVLHEEMERLT